jgi:hypothetical protein
MAFNLPNQLYSNPKDTTSWVRPADWPTITDAAGEVQFLVNDTGNATITLNTTFAKNSGTKITIDWGDGTSDDVTTTVSTSTQHVYTVGSGTSCSRGYTTFKVRVYGDHPSVSITNCKPYSVLISPYIGAGAFVSVGLLEAYYGDGLPVNLSSYFSSNGGNNSSASYQYLEYVKMPSTYASGANFAYMFMNCFNLQKVDMPKTVQSSQTINMTNTFLSCTELKEIVLPYFPSTSTWGQNSTFNACTKLQSIRQYDVSGNIVDTITGWTGGTSVFAGCPNLIKVSLDLSKVSSTANGAFTSCTNLVSATIVGWPQGATCDLTNFFSSCSSLESVTMPVSVTGSCIVTTASMFSACYLLKGSIYLPLGAIFGSMASMFSNCNSIQNVVMPSTNTYSGSLGSLFSNCYTLANVTLPTTVGAVDSSSLFLGCLSITNVTMPSGWSSVTNLASAFNGCVRLRTVTLPSTMNSVTSINGAFTNCSSLESVTLPTSMTSLTNFTNTFSNCYSITSVTMPTSVGSAATANTIFNNCISLTSVTLPTFTPNQVNFTSVFNNCRSIRSINMSSVTLTSATNFNSMFIGCSNLETLTLPNLPAVTAASSFISQCANLRTINNINNLGSTSANVTMSTNTNTNSLTGLTFSCRIATMDFSGGSATNMSALSSLRLLSTVAGQWTGASPQVNISYTNIGYTALVQLFNDIAATGTYSGKTINITGCTGASSLTAGDRTIVTSKGWTITG